MNPPGQGKIKGINGVKIVSVQQMGQAVEFSHARGLQRAGNQYAHWQAEKKKIRAGQGKIQALNGVKIVPVQQTRGAKQN